MPFREKIREMRSVVPWTNKAKHLRRYDIGKRTYGIPTVKDWGTTALKIGKYCSIAEGVTIYLGGEHHTDWVTAYPISEILLPRKGLPPTHFTKGDVIIGDDAWIGSRASILSGVIPHMLDIAWWNWPEEKIIAAAPLLLSENIAEFIATYGPKTP